MKKNNIFLGSIIIGILFLSSASFAQAQFQAPQPFHKVGSSWVLNKISDIFGFGTTSPYAKLAITGTAGQTNPLFQLASSTNTAVVTVDKDGNTTFAQNVTVLGTCTGCGGAVAGGDTQVIFNDGGSAYGGDAGLVYSKSTDVLTVGAAIKIGAYSASPQLYATDTTTGLHFDGAGIMSIHSSGIQSSIVTSTQRWGFGATTSPYAKLSIHAYPSETNTTLFAIASSTASATTTLFNVDNQGRVGIASSSPTRRLSVGGQSGIASSSIAVYEYKYGSPNMATSTAATIDASTSNVQHWGIGLDATTLTLTGFIAGQALKFIVENPNGTAGALTWAAGTGYQLVWAGGTAPTQTTTANKHDVWVFTATQASSTILILGALSANY